MNRIYTDFRNKFLHVAYVYLLKPVFFLFDPELVHDQMTHLGVWLGQHALTRNIIGVLFRYQDPTLTQEILGMHFKNPIGLSAGFDKNAELMQILPEVGFGFAEVGSITGGPCAGNLRPRLWRLLKSKSLLVYYGLKNDGCEVIAEKLQGKVFKIPLGVNVAMTNIDLNLDIDNAVRDFAKAFRIMEPFGDYLTINISCPNARGGQPFIIGDNLVKLLDVLEKIPTKKPVFIKLSPDLGKVELDRILEIVKPRRVHGIICSNLTKNRNNEKIMDGDVPSVGGFSGKIVQDLADQMLSYIYQKEGKRFVLIGCGGVSTVLDAYKKIRLGASLVQMLTGMIFEGPQVVSSINLGLAELLKRDGFRKVADAVGVDKC